MTCLTAHLRRLAPAEQLLEASLGMRLLDRSPLGYVLTTAGEHMLASAERVEDEILGLERRLLGGDVRLAGSLRVTTTDTLLHGLLVTHPDLRRTARVRAFMETLARGLRRDRALLEGEAA